MKRWSAWKDRITVVLIVSAFAWSAISVATRRTRAAVDGEIVLRIAHWQLEPGFREAVNVMAEEYRTTVNPNVRIVQEAIPEQIYGQWASSQLVGGTAPDLIAPGNSLPPAVWSNYLNRYCLPLTDKVREPNPHNAGTDLEGVPLFQTYQDQMRAGYVEDLQNYMAVPLFAFATRLFYNENLLEQLTGSKDPPKNLAEFLAVCKVIESKKDPKGRRYVSLVGSKYHGPMWEWGLFNPLTWTVLYQADLNRDGYVANDEFYAAVRGGLVTFDHPAIRARLEVVDLITARFQPGWLGLNRDEGVFLFAQERAVFIPTGTWDANSLQEQAKGLFTVKVIPFPFPSADDPKFGKFATARPYDRPGNSMGFCVTRGSRHADIAFDFLRFLASKKGNEKFNRIVGWIPAVKGAKRPDFLAGFEPVFRGQYSAFTPTAGGRTEVRWNQLYDLMRIQQLSVDDLIRQYEPIYKSEGAEDFAEIQRNWGRSLRIAEQFMAAIRHDMVTAAPDAQAAAYHKYVQLSSGRLLFPPLSQTQLKVAVESRPAAPYRYSEVAVENIARGVSKVGGGRSP